jgi:hypothetical protein
MFAILQAVGMFVAHLFKLRSSAPASGCSWLSEERTIQQFAKLGLAKESKKTAIHNSLHDS